MRQILATILLGILLFLSHGVDSHKHHQHKKSKKSSSPSILNSEKLSTRAPRSPPPPSPRSKPKRPPPPRKRPPPPSPRRKSPPPPRRRSPPPPPKSIPSPPQSPPSPVPSPSPSPSPLSDGPTFYTYSIIQEYPHNTSSFTEGLAYDEICNLPTQCQGIFWESTGLYGQSTVRQVDLNTGSAMRLKLLPDIYFGEGITKLNNTLYQLTWRSGKTFTYAANNFNNNKLTKVREKNNKMNFICLIKIISY
jgi:hypothetical protein